MLLSFSVRVAERPPVWEIVVYFVYSVCVFRERLSNCLFASFSYGFEVGMLDLIVLVPNHCLVFHTNLNSYFSISTLSIGFFPCGYTTMNKLVIVILMFFAYFQVAGNSDFKFF